MAWLRLRCSPVIKLLSLICKPPLAQEVLGTLPTQRSGRDAKTRSPKRIIYVWLCIRALHLRSDKSNCCESPRTCDMSAMNCLPGCNLLIKSTFSCDHQHSCSQRRCTFLGGFGCVTQGTRHTWHTRLENMHDGLVLVRTSVADQAGAAEALYILQAWSA